MGLRSLRQGKSLFEEQRMRHGNVLKGLGNWLLVISVYDEFDMTKVIVALIPCFWDAYLDFLTSFKGSLVADFRSNSSD